MCPVPRSIQYPSWDWRESRDFDELNHILQESKKLGRALESLSRSEWLQPRRAHTHTHTHSMIFTCRNKAKTFLQMSLEIQR